LKDSKSKSQPNANPDSDFDYGPDRVGCITRLVNRRLPYPLGRFHAIVSVRPEMVDFGSGQGLSNFETAGASEANAYRGA
jgi:hypothetical protein